MDRKKKSKLIRLNLKKVFAKVRLLEMWKKMETVNSKWVGFLLGLGNNPKRLFCTSQHVSYVYQFVLAYVKCKGGGLNARY